MKYSLSELNPIAEEADFHVSVIEKAVHLLNLLNTLNSHPVLKGKLALKGGTALNLFVFDMPRLSVDIDLNYIGALDREGMMADRPKVEQAMRAVFGREEFVVKRVPGDHAGGKWRLAYQSYTGDSGNLEVDVNFMFRQPLWDVTRLDSHRLGKFQAKNIPVFHSYELFAGKLAALFSRDQARDLFDAHKLLNHGREIKQEDLRLAFVVYGAMNRKDWRTISLEDISFNADELKQRLFPVLRQELVSYQDDTTSYGKTLVEECRRKLSAVYPLSDNEVKFLDLILNKGEIEPSLLTASADLQGRIKQHPMLQWKAMNARKHPGIK
jgi:predicted nucleotidyltransferase component of viral defense system